LTSKMLSINPRSLISGLRSDGRFKELYHVPGFVEFPQDGIVS